MYNPNKMRRFVGTTYMSSLPKTATPNEVRSFRFIRELERLPPSAAIQYKHDGVNQSVHPICLNICDYISPCERQLSKIGIMSCSASATASSGVISPRAALAYIFGMMKVPNTSPIAGFAGPGCPMTVDHDSDSRSSRSLSIGREPKGSTSSQPPSARSCGTVLLKAGKL